MGFPLHTPYILGTWNVWWRMATQNLSCSVSELQDAVKSKSLTVRRSARPLEEAGRFGVPSATISKIWGSVVIEGIKIEKPWPNWEESSSSKSDLYGGFI